MKHMVVVLVSMQHLHEIYIANLEWSIGELFPLMFGSLAPWATPLPVGLGELLVSVGEHGQSAPNVWCLNAISNVRRLSCAQRSTSC